MMPVAIVAAVTAIGAMLRLVMLHDSLFADELSTYWIVSGHSLGDVISTVHTDAEITPPLFFVLSWLATKISLTAEMLRLPSFIAGVTTIPLVYLVGTRTVGRPAGLVASAITALSPFMIYYSTEARGYASMIALALLSTLAMLVAIDAGRGRWWILYAVSSCAAVYSHYTAVFVLAAQFLWVLWTHPEARRAALFANVGAIAGFSPWISGLLADADSPTTKILGAIEPFTAEQVRLSLEHWSIGYPLGSTAFPFRDASLHAVPGYAALVLVAAALILGVIGVWQALRRIRPRPGDPTFLIIGLALAAPIGEALVSLVSTDLFSTRNLAVSWPAFAICFSALITAAPRRLRVVSIALVVVAFGFGAMRTLDQDHRRPQFDAVAEYIDSQDRSDIVFDGAVLSPGPLGGLDAALNGPRSVIRVGWSPERDHPFGFSDPHLPVRDVVKQATMGNQSHQVILVTGDLPALDRIRREAVAALPPGFRLTQAKTYPGIITLEALVFGSTP